MELTPLQVARIHAHLTRIHRILTEATQPQAADLDTLIQAWVTEHLRYAPGHRIQADDARNRFQNDTGITVNPQQFGHRVALPRQRSNGHTYYLGVKMI